ncbi:H-type small acid-soluble spore protein [Clostridium thermarum]|uniref:H-type small acid-soluble spore protein n=1 Tax=Clostridium thermarum TaxID=1716543 RepID=UPI00111F58A2|nr:H-type small acid-soluble spore protein [Clostridium thermarum]
MNCQDAKELVESKGYIDVEYNNKSVWIERLNKEEDTALVKEINGDKEYLVLLSELSMTEEKRNKVLK